MSMEQPRYLEQPAEIKMIQRKHLRKHQTKAPTLTATQTPMQAPIQTLMPTETLASSQTPTPTQTPMQTPTVLTEQQLIDVIGPYPYHAPPGSIWVPNGWKLQQESTDFKTLFLNRIKPITSKEKKKRTQIDLRAKVYNFYSHFTLVKRFAICLRLITTSLNSNLGCISSGAFT